MVDRGKGNLGQTPVGPLLAHRNLAIPSIFSATLWMSSAPGLFSYWCHVVACWVSPLMAISGHEIVTQVNCGSQGCGLGTCHPVSSM